MQLTDPLLFTCELHDVIALRVVLPTGDIEHISIGDTPSGVALPAGFTAVSVDIHEAVPDALRRNISLTLALTNASILDGGEMSCTDSTWRKVVMAACPIESNIIISKYSISKYNNNCIANAYYKKQQQKTN